MDENSAVKTDVTPTALPVEPPPVLPKIPQKHGVSKIIFILPVLLILILGGTYLYMQNLSTAPEPEIAIIPKPTVKPFFLTIASPKSTTTSVNGEVLVNGETLPDSTVMIYTDTDQTVIDSGPDGKFESTVVVGDNGGLIRITAVSGKGEEKTETFNIADNSVSLIMGQNDVLGKSDAAPGQVKKAATSEGSKSDTKITEPKTITTPEVKANKNSFSSLTAKNITPEKNDEEKVKAEKIKNDLVKKFLETKTITEKTNKLGSVKIREMLKTESTGSGSVSTASAKFRKMAVLEASAASTLKRNALSGVITAVGNGFITVAHQIQRDRIYTVYFNTFTSVTAKDQNTALAVGMRVACVGEPIDNGLLAKLIHIIPGSATGIFNRLPVASGGADLRVSPTLSATVSASPTKPATPSATVKVTIAPTVTSTPVPTPTIGIATTP